MIIAVTGYRYYTDRGFINNTMDYWANWSQAHSQPLHVRVGDADGADDMAIHWCQENNVSHFVFRALRFASGALVGGEGPARNRRMLLGIGDPYPGATDMLLGFPRTDRVSIKVPGSGTWGCMIKASELGIMVQIPAYHPTGVS